MFRETIYHASIKDLKPLSGEIEMDEAMFGGKRPGKRGWGASGKLKRPYSLVLHVTLKPEVSTILMTDLPIPFYRSVVIMWSY